MLNQTASYAASASIHQSDVEAIRSAMAAMDDLLVRVTHVVGRLAGVRPDEVGVPSVPPAPSGVIPSLRARAEEMLMFGGYVSTELDRLEKML